MFFRGTDANKGAGLGLYIVKEAIEKLKGEISIESVIGEGTTFKIKLPNLISNNEAVSNNRMEAVF